MYHYNLSCKSNVRRLQTPVSCNPIKPYTSATIPDNTIRAASSSHAFGKVCGCDILDFELTVFLVHSLCHLGAVLNHVEHIFSLSKMLLSICSDVRHVRVEFRGTIVLTFGSICRMLKDKWLVTSSTLSVKSECLETQLGFNDSLCSVQAQWSCLVGIAGVRFLASTVIVELRRPRGLRVRNDVDAEHIACLQLKVFVSLLRCWEPLCPGIV